MSRDGWRLGIRESGSQIVRGGRREVADYLYLGKVLTIDEGSLGGLPAYRFLCSNKDDDSSRTSIYINTILPFVQSWYNKEDLSDYYGSYLVAGGYFLLDAVNISASEWDFSTIDRGGHIEEEVYRNHKGEFDIISYMGKSLITRGGEHFEGLGDPDAWLRDE